MAKNLVIVESPAKAKTINKYLGADFKVLASYGHVRDLLPKQGAVDPDNDFAMQYELIARNKQHIDTIVTAMKKADVLMLAPDPDREGEAIAWNVAYTLREKKVLEGKHIQRIVFNEITRSAINAAIENPREISMDLVQAQQARRALDYLVGFNLSPLLWKKVRRGLSAGRVQSPALRLIVERELDIEKFKAQEYWTIESDLHAGGQDFVAKLVIYKNKKLEQFSLTNEQEASAVKNDLIQQAKGKLLVTQVTKKQRKRHPAPPFITSTLQQEAVRKLGFTAQRTMQIAQQLYEGVDIGAGSVGLITYMRTDSVNLATEAINDIRELIKKHYGEENLPNAVRIFKTKIKNAQEAHEAIRPTMAQRSPETIRAYLSVEQFKLYSLIWRRTIACQMIPATLHTVAIDLQCGKLGNCFRGHGSTIANPGFMTVYLASVDDSKADDGDEKRLPELQSGDRVDLKSICSKQHFTEPPPRYSEASLIKALEEFGIGRPSTYAAIISTLQNRDYATLEKKRFYPTDVGRIVNKFLAKYFTQYVDYNFTAHLEDKLDQVARAERQWIPLLHQFWQPFKELIDKIDGTVQRSDVTQEKLDEPCPQCGKPLSIRLGSTGRFIGCTAFPECSYTRSIKENTQEAETAAIIGDRQCPKDGADLVIKHGRYGKFIGCSNYPQCKFIEPLVKPRNTNVNCPKCNIGTMLQRQSKRGKIFFSCSQYPKCNYALWNEPVNETCAKCGFPILTSKTTKRSGTQKICPQQDCDFIEHVDA